MKFTTPAIVALLALVSGVQPAYAADEAQPEAATAFGGMVTILSDYAWRGISQTDQHPAVQGMVYYMPDHGPYAGIWGSNVDYTDAEANHVSKEAALFAGYKFSVAGEVLIDAGVQQILCADSAESTDHYDYLEAHVAASKDFGFTALAVQGNFSPEFSGDSGHEENINVSDTSPIAKTGVSFTATAGHTWIENTVAYGNPDWTDGSAGLGYTVQGFNLALTVVDTSLSRAECGGNAGCSLRGVASVARSF